ncbi:hypothetical protein Ddc_12022 [Ditylenchus destructor]|nr:hypothetical protein Ddc_12022 [Ditylenchus destructor]
MNMPVLPPLRKCSSEQTGAIFASGPGIFCNWPTEYVYYQTWSPYEAGKDKKLVGDEKFKTFKQIFDDAELLAKVQKQNGKKARILKTEWDRIKEARKIKISPYDRSPRTHADWKVSTTSEKRQQTDTNTKSPLSNSNSTPTSDKTPAKKVTVLEKPPPAKTKPMSRPARPVTRPKADPQVETVSKPKPEAVPKTPKATPKDPETPVPTKKENEEAKVEPPTNSAIAQQKSDPEGSKAKENQPTASPSARPVTRPKADPKVETVLKPKVEAVSKLKAEEAPKPTPKDPETPVPPKKKNEEKKIEPPTNSAITEQKSAPEEPKAKQKQPTASPSVQSPIPGEFPVTDESAEEALKAIIHAKGLDNGGMDAQVFVPTSDHLWALYVKLDEIESVLLLIDDNLKIRPNAMRQSMLDGYWSSAQRQMRATPGSSRAIIFVSTKVLEKMGVWNQSGNRLFEQVYQTMNTGQLSANELIISFLQFAIDFVKDNSIGRASSLVTLLKFLVKWLYWIDYWNIYKVDNIPMMRLTVLTIRQLVDFLNDTLGITAMPSNIDAAKEKLGNVILTKSEVDGYASENMPGTFPTR